MELYFPIKGYERYSVSTSGHVRNNDTGRILKPSIATTGYCVVGLRKNNISKTINIHKLVAEKYIPNPLNYKCITHIDGDKSNNNINNLKWSETNNMVKKRNNLIMKCKELLKLIKEVEQIKNDVYHHIIELGGEDRHQ